MNHPDTAKLVVAVAKLREWAAECAECGGTGEVTVAIFPNGGEGTNSCDECADIRKVIAECAP
jgi:hypothetical protein